MGYTDEKNVQMLISLMKEHGIRKVIASPGTTNITFVGSVQNDPFFEVYSCVDERSAAYMACGLAKESGEAVALSCTGATASRNYVSALTEAYYDKIPVLAITSTQFVGLVGNNVPQVIDRSSPLKDITRYNTLIPTINCNNDEWLCTVEINKALLELFRDGGGPVHINLETTYSTNFDSSELKKCRIIRRITNKDAFPNITHNKVAIFVGEHKKWDENTVKAIEEFCDKYNAVVLVDHTSNYFGSHAVLPNMVCSQDHYYPQCGEVDLLIHLGNISGAYLVIKPKTVWRVNPDGEIRDKFKKTRYVFEMEEIDFFEKYNKKTDVKKDNSYLKEWNKEIDAITSNVQELPFSNIWIAKNTYNRLNKEMVLHLGILNSLRSWNFFDNPNKVLTYCNTGGFGIDGCMSSLLGASLHDKNKLYIGVIGDLSFFYDLNSLGNKNISNNVRIMLINNGKGVEFRNYNHKAAHFGENADNYIAAGGHFGNKSRTLVKHYSEDLGYDYLCADNKDDYLKNIEKFLSKNDKSIVFEIFLEDTNEIQALKSIRNINSSLINKDTIKSAVKKIIGK